MIWMLIGYMFLFIWRPFEIWPILATIRVERVYMLVAIGATLWSGPRMARTSVTPAILALAAAITISWLVSPWRETADATTTVSDWFKILVFYFLVLCHVKTERDLEVLVSGFCAAVGLLMVHSTWEFLNGRHMYSMGIPRMRGVNETFGQPNTYAGTIALCAPFFVLTIRHGHTAWMRFAGVSALGLILFSVMKTGSRTSFLALAVFGLLGILRSKYKIRITLIALVVAIGFWKMAPEKIRLRFLSTVDSSVYESGEIGGNTSAEARTEGFYEGWRVFKRFPLTGCGPGGWIPATNWVIESHNLYGQIPAELGTVGLVAFAWLLAAFGWNFLAIRRTYKQLGTPRDFLFDVSRALEIGIILLLLTGFAGHSLYRFNWIWFAAFLGATSAIVAQNAHATQVTARGHEENWALDGNER